MKGKLLEHMPQVFNADQQEALLDFVRSMIASAVRSEGGETTTGQYDEIKATIKTV